MKIPPILLLLAAIATQTSHADVIFYEELPYFQVSDSPFWERFENGEKAFLEDFEDHELNTPHVVSWDVPRLGTLQIGRTHKFANGGGILVNELTTTSVDADDGLNGDFIGNGGDSWTTINASNGQILGHIEFRFEPDALGRFPIWVGFVITEALDPFNDVEFGTGTLSGPESPEFEYDPISWNPPISFPGDTRAHRFFGIEVEDGITRLNIDNVRQIDHLQYGYAIPEPSGVVLLLVTACATLMGRRRPRARR